MRPQGGRLHRPTRTGGSGLRRVVFQLGRKVRSLDERGRGDMERAFHHIFQLTRIAGPRIMPQKPPRFGRKVLSCFSGDSGFSEKMFRQRRDVFRPFPQGGHGNDHDVEPIIQVLAEFSLFNRLRQVAVCGGQNAHVDPTGRFSSQTARLVILKKPEQAHLRFRRHFTYFIQKNGAAVRQFKLSRLSSLVGSGKRPGFIAEQFALHQIARNRAAVHDDERLAPTGGSIVNGVGEQLFTGAAFAKDQRGYVAFGREFGQLHRPAEQRRNPHYVVKGIDRPGPVLCRF